MLFWQARAIRGPSDISVMNTSAVVSCEASQKMRGASWLFYDFKPHRLDLLLNCWQPRIPFKNLTRANFWLNLVSLPVRQKFAVGSSRWVFWVLKRTPSHYFFFIVFLLPWVFFARGRAPLDQFWWNLVQMFLGGRSRLPPTKIEIAPQGPDSCRKTPILGILGAYRRG